MARRPLLATRKIGESLRSYQSKNESEANKTLLMYHRNRTLFFDKVYGFGKSLGEVPLGDSFDHYNRFLGETKSFHKKRKRKKSERNSVFRMIQFVLPCFSTFTQLFFNPNLKKKDLSPKGKTISHFITLALKWFLAVDCRLTG